MKPKKGLSRSQIQQFVPIQSWMINPVYFLTSPLLTFILLLSCHLRRGLPSGPFPSGFTIKPRANFTSPRLPVQHDTVSLI